MTLKSNISSSKRRPGTYATFDFISAARGLAPGNRKLALIGTLSPSAGATPLIPVQVFSESDADKLAGQGSQLALMAKKAIGVLNAAGTPEVQVWLCGMAETGANRVDTVSISGTATASGDIVLNISGRAIRAGVSLGDSAVTVASRINDAINLQAANLPVTATVAAGTITITSAIAGLVSTGYALNSSESVSGITVTVTNDVAGGGLQDMTDALEALSRDEFHSIGFENTFSTDITALDTHLDETWSASKKLFRHAFMGYNATLGSAQVLSDSANDERIVIVSYEDCPTFAGEISAAVAAARLTNERPSTNYDFFELDLPAPPAASVYGDAEIESALGSGVTPLLPTPNGKTEIVRLITTKYTESGAPFENLVDLSNSYTVAFYTKLVDASMARSIKGKNLDSTLLAFLRDQIVLILKEGERLGDLHNVQFHLPDVRVEAHPSIPTRALAHVPISVVPNAHQVDGTYVMHIEAATV